MLTCLICRKWCSFRLKHSIKGRFRAHWKDQQEYSQYALLATLFSEHAVLSLNWDDCEPWLDTASFLSRVLAVVGKILQPTLSSKNLWYRASRYCSLTSEPLWMQRRRIWAPQKTQACWHCSSSKSRPTLSTSGTHLQTSLRLLSWTEKHHELFWREKPCQSGGTLTSC